MQRWHYKIMNTLCLKTGTLFEKENFHPLTLPFQREFPLSHPSFPKRIATLSPSLSKENFHPPTLLFQRELPLSHPSFPITQSQWEKILTTNTVLSKKKQNLKQSWLLALWNKTKIHTIPNSQSLHPHPTPHHSPVSSLTHHLHPTDQTPHAPLTWTSFYHHSPICCAAMSTSLTTGAKASDVKKNRFAMYTAYDRRRSFICCLLCVPAQSTHKIFNVS